MCNISEDVKQLAKLIGDDKHIDDRQYSKYYKLAVKIMGTVEKQTAESKRQFQLDTER